MPHLLCHKNKLFSRAGTRRSKFACYFCGNMFGWMLIVARCEPYRRFEYLITFLFDLKHRRRQRSKSHSHTSHTYEGSFKKKIVLL